MREAVDEGGLVKRLCAEILSASDLKGISRARGFPVVGGSKEDLARAVAARFLDPLGIPEAMGSITGPPLAALHLAAASEGPLPLAALAPVFDPECEPYDLEYRFLWREVAASLLAKGVLLADEEGDSGYSEKSRYARFRLVLPEAFRRFLPPFPVPVEPLEGEGDRGTAREVLAEALAAFVSGTPAPGRAAERGSLPARLASALRIEEGVLGLRGLDRPSARSLHRWLSARWEEGLPKGDRHSSSLAAGRVARHVLGHLPAARGCTPRALADALASLGLAAKPREVAAFCEEGTAAGLLHRYPRRAGEPLYLLAGGSADGTPEGEDALVVLPQAGGVRVNERRSPLLSVIEAAAVSRAKVLDGALLLEPDLVRMGRGWGELGQSPTMAALRSASRAFEEAARTVEGARGRVTVHRGLAVLRVEDVGLHAAVRSRFPGAVREITGEYLAVLRGAVEEVLAFAKKEGFVARRMP